MTAPQPSPSAKLAEELEQHSHHSYEGPCSIAEIEHEGVDVRRVVPAELFARVLAALRADASGEALVMEVTKAAHEHDGWWRISKHLMGLLRAHLALQPSELVYDKGGQDTTTTVEVTVVTQPSAGADMNTTMPTPTGHCVSCGFMTYANMHHDCPTVTELPLSGAQGETPLTDALFSRHIMEARDFKPADMQKEGMRQVRELLVHSRKLEAELSALRHQYEELIMGVARKYPDETRHQTALRYILRAEQSSDNVGSALRRQGAEGEG